MSRWVILLCFAPLLAFTQTEKSTVFSLDSFLSVVKKHHPIALQASLQTKKGDATLQKARGGFDPKIQADIAQKYFKEKEYFELGESKLKIPTWFGIELEGGYERNQGQFLNPENNVPNAGLWFAGVSVPIGKGLFIDERRAELRKAQSIVIQSQAERDLILNELLFSAGIAYWDWFKSYNNLLVYIEAYQLAEERVNAIKQSAVLGDAPFIDTLEAGIQLQNRILNLEQTKLNYKNSTAYLSIFLWKEGVIPLEVKEGIIPESMDNIRAEKLQLSIEMDSLLNKHPELRRSRAKIEQLKIEERWSKEQLKPSLNLKYKPITEAITNDPFAEYSINNYTWGLQFEFPIFLRKERGKLNLVQLKKNESEFLLQNKRELLDYKIEVAINEFETTQGQIQLYSKTTQDYKSLLDGERRLFNNGESSLFLVNSRELGFINARIKLIELVAKNKNSILKLDYALGNLN